jgi:SnoaL-like domain
MTRPSTPLTGNLERVLAFVAAFDRRWPSEEEIRALLARDVRFVERPNLVNPAGSERDAEGIVAGVAAGKQLLAWQSYEVLDHVAQDDLVVLRMRWTGGLAVDAGAWKQGTVLSAWSVGHYRLDKGLIVEIEQHDCYEVPVPPKTA